MGLRILFITGIFVCFLPFSSRAAIMSSEVRSEKMRDYDMLLNGEIRPVEKELIERAPSPFVPDLGQASAKVVSSRSALSDEELLEELANYINPTGIFMFGGEFYLLFKERKLKEGSDLEVNYGGTPYKVMIERITGAAYSVRYGDAELQLKLK